MTYAPASIKTAQTYLRSKTGLPWVSLGIVGDEKHRGGYHCGWNRRRIVNGTLADYAWQESTRDSSHKTDAAAALDVGNFAVGGRTLRGFSVWLVGECARGAADTRDIREVIYSPDGKTVKRWDRLGKRTGGDDSHLTHTHISYFRDSEHRDKTALFKRYFEGGSAPSSGVPVPTMREGDSGPSVAALQTALNATVGAGLAVDGDYGPKTTVGVKLLQRRAGITVDGIYGPASERALRTLLEDDVDLTDKIKLTSWAKDQYKLSEIPVSAALGEGWIYSRAASDRAGALLIEQAAQTALLRQIAAGQSGLSEEAIAAAVEAGVRRVVPSAEAIAAAVAAAVDHELDTAAVVAALREVLGSLDGAD